MEEAKSQMKKKGQSDTGTNQRWKIEPETLCRNYDPRRPPNVTHLLYEIRWGKSPKTWKNWCRSDRSHAEINFLQNACEKIKNRKNMPCSITWFLSWSPCGSCSHDIIEFLKAHPNVNLEIRAAQLFKHDKEHNRNGLRNLVNCGVKISIMHLPDYRYCWRTFVAHQKTHTDYWPWFFFPQIMYYFQQLYFVLWVQQNQKHSSQHDGDL
ncbi:C-_U-editing enzyme APOBEC-1 isoform X2 [Rhineura floridana]|uniref:C->U-editing enzyme APOBEC-1 isoform X2 n=1 Tax=Rhineura floridana TaxID=261503 RepID=UPI002AC80396|nr:C->U-editing enzyme APOBEC-1 isoform X2 [Rhineura floridana]